jgi:hypothetical protein
MAKDPKRPPVVSVVVLIFLIQIVILAVLLWLQLAALGATRMATLGSSLTVVLLHGDRWIDALLALGLLALVVASILVTIGLTRMRPWAWLWAMTIQGLRLLLGLIAYFRGDPYTFSMLVPLIAVLLLDQVPVRRAFGQEGATHA